MRASAHVISADFDRIAACSGGIPDVLERAAQRLVAAVPLRSRVLDVGCGTGALARELAAKRGAKVTAIDLSPRMVDVARLRSPASLGIEYAVADLMELSPTGFDVVISTNTLHHLPLADAAARMAAALVPGGMMLIADLFSARGPLELPYNAISWLARPRRPGSRELAAAWDAHWQHDDIPTLPHVRRALRAVLPGVSIRRHISWRYTACWKRPLR
jgi:2-polyprenyl-3-methyl-5-hydroxy-6-metoxy-1,4-benzoquinol methylase